MAPKRETTLTKFNDHTKKVRMCKNVEIKKNQTFILKLKTHKIHFSRDFTINQKRSKMKLLFIIFFIFLMISRVVPQIFRAITKVHATDGRSSLPALDLAMDINVNFKA